MLVTLKELLAIAEERKIAVGAFNAPNLESLRAVMSAAESLQLPVVIQHAQCHDEFIPMAMIAPILLDFAKRAEVPVCVHLDHGETLEYVERALALGFTSVMYDGSVLPYDENARNTKRAVDMARAVGASVEAELGAMGKKELCDGDSASETPPKIYTDPEQAKRFVAETGVDALACSFGTTHGIYLTEPKLDFDVVRRVREETQGIPVVMHGGSGVSAEDFHTAVRAGVRKINYFTYMDKAGGTAAAEYAQARPEGKPYFFTEMARRAQSAMEANVRAAMRTFAMLDAQ